MQEGCPDNGRMIARTLWGAASTAAGALLLLAPLGLVVAAELDEGDFFEELPQIVSVTRLAQSPLETPASVTVIDRRMIEASGAVDIPDLLRLAAGFQVGHPSGGRTTVTYHGMSDEFARRMQVLVDGRSVYTPAFGGVEWPLLALSMEDIDRIEVTRGPNGVTYGANSFLGVINIITLQPSAVGPAFAKVTGGNDGYRKAVARLGGHSDAFDYRVTFEHRADRGLDDSVVNGTDQRHDDKIINQATFRGEYRAAVNDYVSMLFGINAATLGDGQLNNQIDPVRDTVNRTHFEQLGWRHVESSDQETELRFYHDYSNVENAFQTALLSEIFQVPPAAISLYLGVPDQPVLVDQNRVSDRYNIELQHRYRIIPAIRAISGVEARLDRVKAPGLLGPDDWIDSELYRFFTNAEWQATPRWLLNGGVMVENNDIVGTKTSPRLAANYRLNTEQALRVSYTRAYRTPAMLEEYSDYAATYAVSGGVVDQLWKSDGNLGAERNDAWELGLIGDHANGVSYDIKLFQEKISNLISTPTDMNYPEPNCPLAAPLSYPGFCRSIVYENYGTGLTTGGELQFGYRPDSNRMVSLAWSHLFKREGSALLQVTSSGPVYTSMENWRPEDTATLLAEQGLGAGVVLSGMVHHVDGWNNNSGFTTANIKLSKSFSDGGVKGKVAVAINDLLGSYYDFYYYMRSTPQTYLSIEMAF